jgi:hypothetical protein
MTETATGAPPSARRIADRAPYWLFAAYVAVAFALLLFHFGRDFWFFGDEWSFLAERDGADLGDLFRSHGEHWTTLPVISYRLLYQVFALRTYVPYLAVAIAAHLTVCVLLLLVIRRAGVRPWTAVVAASVMVLFGPGQQNMLWAFQIAFTGALAFGFGHLLLSDHAGPIDRRDWIGLALGAGGLMCSGVSLVMVVMVGAYAFVRRGWKVAAFHTAPLALMYVVWFALSRPGGLHNPYDRGPRPAELVDFGWSNLRASVEALAGFDPLALLVVAVLVGGIAVAWSPFDLAATRRVALPLVLLLGALGFAAGTAASRWFANITPSAQSRYLYTMAVLLLCPLAVGADALMRRWPATTPVALGVLVVALVANAGRLDTPVDATYLQRERVFYESLGHSDLARQVPEYVRPNPWFTIGWLRDAAAHGELPDPSSTPLTVRARFPLVLGVAQLDERIDDDCRTLPRNATITPEQGRRFGFDFDREPDPDANYFVQDTLVLTQLDDSGKPVSTFGLREEFGPAFEVVRDGLTLRLNAADPTQRVVLCR